MSLRSRLSISAAVAALFCAAPAQALPVAAIAAAFTAFGVTASATVLAITTFAVNTAIGAIANFALNKVFAPKTSESAAASAQERQASVTTLSVGENPRELIVGRAATGGSLVDAFNYGGQNGTDWEVLIVAIADHLCDALEGFYVGDTYVTFTGDGVVPGYNSQLEVYWRHGAADDAAFPSTLVDAAAAADPVVTALQSGALRGMAKVAVAYKADASDATSPVWSGGRPTFLWVVRGARMYDPRFDTSVGGFGSQRWSDPSTRVWSQNAEICRYNYARGIYALNQVDDPEQLLIGRGLSIFEAPPQRVFAAANLCDEEVDIGGGATEPRYRVGGVIQATETFVSVETRFAAATGGVITQPQGGVDVEPGQAKTPVASITDDDLIVGAALQWSSFKSGQDQVNTVIPRYVEPSQKWADHGAPIVRDLGDVQADGGPAEQTISLDLVTSRTQAQRIGEIAYRQGRKERSGALPLGPRFSHLEEGDWVTYTSARRTGGLPVDFRIKSYAVGQDWRTTLAIEETGYDVYGFGGDPSTATVWSRPPPAGALELHGVTAEEFDTTGDDNSVVPGVRFHWNTPVDPAIQRIRAEVRLVGTITSTPTIIDLVNAGVALVTAGVPSDRSIEVRLVPLGGPGRPIIPGSWIPISSGQLIASNVVRVLNRSAAEAMQTLDRVDTASSTLLADTAALAKAFLAGLDAFHTQGKTIELLNYEGDSTSPIKVVFRSALNVLTDANTLTATRFTYFGLLNDTSQTVILDLDKLKLSPTESFGSRLTSINTSLGANSAAITTETSNRVSAVGAVASSLSALSTTVSGHTSTLTTYGYSIDGLNAKWGVAVSVGTDGHKRIGGLVVNGTGESVAFNVIADVFTISAADGSANVSFGVSGGLTYATNLVAQTVFANSITANHIVGGAVTDTATYETSGGAISTGSELYVGGFDYTSIGGKHVLNVYGEVATTTGTPAGGILRLKRDGTEIARGNTYCPGNWGGQGIAFAKVDQPGVGTFHYELTYQATPSSGAANAGHSTLILTELKR